MSYEPKISQYKIHRNTHPHETRWKTTGPPENNKKKHPKLPKRNDKQHYDDECLYT